MIMNSNVRLILIFPILLPALLSACSKNGTAGLAPLQNTTTVAAPSTFNPPADGKLTPRQIDTYLAVKSRELETLTKANQAAQATESDSAAVAKGDSRGAGGVAHRGRYVGSDELAATQLGVASDEFDWIKDTVIDASAQLLMSELHGVNKSLVDKLQAAVAHYEKNLFNATDTQEKNRLMEHVNDLKRQIAAIEQEMGQKSQLSDAMLANMQLLQPHLVQIKTLQTQIDATRRK